MPLYPYKCGKCGTEVLKKMPYYGDEEYHKKVFPCECGGNFKRGWKRIVSKKKNKACHSRDNMV
tara:strand:- start:91 stop:282 length:192 start_codon:yes stop_codon:yes gene_type:complete